MAHSSAISIITPGETTFSSVPQCEITHAMTLPTNNRQLNLLAKNSVIDFFVDYVN